MHTYDVIIPCHNGAETVMSAVQSALRNAGVVGVIVVDDGSTDDSLAVLGEIDDQRVRIQHQPNGGPGSARNNGVKLGTADRLVFLDADDVLLPESIEVFESVQSAELVRAGIVLVSPNGDEELHVPLADPRPFNRGMPSPGSFAISRRLFTQLDGYDERFWYGENAELMLRAGQRLGGLDKVPCIARVTVLARYDPDKGSTHYRRKRIESVDLVREKHHRSLRQDPQMRRNYNAVAAVLLRAEGDRRGSMAAAFRAALVWPPEARAWLRALRSVLEFVARRSSSQDNGVAAHSMEGSLPSDAKRDEMASAATAADGSTAAKPYDGDDV